MAARKLIVAVIFVAAASFAAGRHVGDAWNDAERRAFLIERARLLEQMAPAEGNPAPIDRQRDLYGNPVSPAVDSYRIDAAGVSSPEHQLDRPLLRLKPPVG